MGAEPSSHRTDTDDTGTPTPSPLVEEVDRAAFIPDRIWVRDRDRGGYNTVDRDTDPDAWRAAVDADAFVVTQLDGHNDETSAHVEIGSRPTSSSSAPWIMAGMLDALEVQSGHRVLEIGTGTGWNAALLAHRVGDGGDVTSVEIDPGLVDTARRALDHGGHRVRTVCADGLAGVAEHAPYDRVISTAAIVEIVPHAWLDQLRPGGILVTPWTTAFDGGAQLRMERPSHDGRAEFGAEGAARVLGVGRFSGNLAFMHVRSQRPPLWARDLTDEDLADAETRTTDCRSNDFAHMFDPAEGMFGIGAQLSGITVDLLWLADESDDALIDLDDPTSGSFARVTGEFADPTPFVVHQLGPRRLWDEAEAAYDWWWDHGQPSPERFGLTVTTADQTLWLDSPDNLVRAWA